MCGIVGYTGPQSASIPLIEGLRRLEYRGYDSAGIALGTPTSLFIEKRAGKLANLESALSPNIPTVHSGISHTRWATHGGPTDRNAHPHVDNEGKLAVIHNGIIENYASLKEALSTRGFVFHSDTDTEVLVNLIEDVLQTQQVSLEEAVRVALNQVVGAYAIAVFDKTKPNEIIVARLGSPIAIGIGENNKEFFIASDASPFIEYTKDAIYLDDEELAIIKIDRDILKGIGMRLEQAK